MGGSNSQIFTNYHTSWFNGQCSLCSNTSYRHGTRSSEVESCLSRGNFFVMGASHIFEPNIVRLAAGTFSQNMYRARNRNYNATQIDGIRWYWWPNASIGFSAAPMGLLTRNGADASHEICDYRMSWHVDNGMGGYRVGCMYYMEHDEMWRKLMYSCNVSNSSFWNLTNMTNSSNGQVCFFFLEYKKYKPAAIPAPRMIHMFLELWSHGPY
jgi:hypothetical protein